ncbi:Ankyrin repeat domain-containing protein 13 protein [Raphanus sativus]|nr:Ankyrin repeat domain-containing protein 13 protein [Raphanus sativus]
MCSASLLPPRGLQEYNKGLRPVLWLTPDFPLKTEELLPLLDILANKMMKPHTLKKNGGKAGSVDISSRDPFEYLATCHIGHHVEVHLKDGSVYSGVFHASADVENNFGEETFLASDNTTVREEIVTENDLEHLLQLLEVGNATREWQSMMDKTAPNMSYQAWRHDKSSIRVLITFTMQSHQTVQRHGRQEEQETSCF